MLLSRRVDLERRMGRVPPVTLAILALLAAIFVAEVWTDALRSRESIIAAGALVRQRVVAGEYWRLLTAPWLHGSAGHLIGNGIAPISTLTIEPASPLNMYSTRNWARPNAASLTIPRM